MNDAPFETPFFLIDEERLLDNLKKIESVRESSGAKSLLALKCFSSWPLFDLMSEYMDGVTSSSVYEARLGYEEFGKETHAYSVAFSENEIAEVKKYADTIIFNSVNQLQTFYEQARGINIGLRLNPMISCSDYDIADPACEYSRLGVCGYQSALETARLINGVMFHYNCENKDFSNFSALLGKISHTYEELLYRLDWVSLGGGIYFTRDDYPLEKFGNELKKFGNRFDLQIYLEPGETAVTDSASLIVTVLDIVRNEIDIAIVDSSTEAHMPDLLIYREQADIESASSGKYHYQIAGNSCLAGDIFGNFYSDSPLKIGDQICIADAAGYTMVKLNWFNGLKMPSVVVKRLNGDYDLIKTFGYQDFKKNLGECR